MPDLNETKTRALLINPQLERAGWNLSDHSQVQFEVPVKGYDPTPWNGFTDFCLNDVDGSVLAVIEAKRTARNAREGEQQFRHYVAEIAAKQDIPPFGFMTNGLHHFFWEVDLAHPRSNNLPLSIRYCPYNSPFKNRWNRFCLPLWAARRGYTTTRSPIPLHKAWGCSTQSACLKRAIRDRCSLENSIAIRSPRWRGRVSGVGW